MSLRNSINTIPTITTLYDTGKLDKSIPASTDLVISPSAAINNIISVWKGDITKLAADAIVNAAKPSLLGGGGVDGAIHQAAGPGLLAECRGLGITCAVGQAVITKGYKLPAAHVIHTVGPIYDGSSGVEQKLRSCYERSLTLAKNNGIQTIAFSSISTGVYGYPRLDAARVACRAVREFLEANPHRLHRVVFVAFEQKDVDVYNQVLP